MKWVRIVCLSLLIPAIAVAAMWNHTFGEATCVDLPPEGGYDGESEAWSTGSLGSVANGYAWVEYYNGTGTGWDSRIHRPHSGPPVESGGGYYPGVDWAGNTYTGNPVTHWCVTVNCAILDATANVSSIWN